MYCIFQCMCVCVYVYICGGRCIAHTVSLRRHLEVFNTAGRVQSGYHSDSFRYVRVYIMYVCMYVCMCVYVCVCMYVCNHVTCI